MKSRDHSLATRTSGAATPDLAPLNDPYPGVVIYSSTHSTCVYARHAGMLSSCVLSKKQHQQPHCFWFGVRLWEYTRAFSTINSWYNNTCASQTVKRQTPYRLSNPHFHIDSNHLAFRFRQQFQQDQMQSNNIQEKPHMDIIICWMHKKIDAPHISGQRTGSNLKYHNQKLIPVGSI